MVLSTKTLGVLAVLAIIFSILLNTVDKKPVEKLMDAEEDLEAKRMFRHISAQQTSFTIQKGKMYRMGDAVFLAEDLPAALTHIMEPISFDSVIITQVGVVAGPIYNIQGYDDKIHILE